MKQLQSYHKVHHQLCTHTLRDVLVVMNGTGGVAVNGCGKRGVGFQQRVWFLGQGNRDVGYQQRVWFLWGWGNRDEGYQQRV